MEQGLKGAYTESAAPPAQGALPAFFRQLAHMGLLHAGDIHTTPDGFCALGRSIASLLMSRGIDTFLNEQGQERRCDRFFDDWYFYTVPDGAGSVCSLIKLREQEHDAQEGIPADADNPGVTVSFIAFDTPVFLSCLSQPSPERRQALNREINRVVAARGQTHHPALKAYFNTPRSHGPYLIAELYVQHIASFARGGSVAVPGYYRALYERRGAKRFGPASFVEENNRAAGCTVCDHERIFLADARALSPYEKRAILCTHTGNPGFHSFAAEVQYHARFLFPLARLTLPGLGRSVYASAIRADMTIHGAQWGPWAPFYRLNSRLVKKQRQLHPMSPDAL